MMPNIMIKEDRSEFTTLVSQQKQFIEIFPLEKLSNTQAKHIGNRAHYTHWADSTCGQGLDLLPHKEKLGTSGIGKGSRTLPSSRSF